MSRPNSEEPRPQASRPKNRQTSQSKLRRGKRNCPVCLAALPANQARTRLVRACPECQAHPSKGKRCRRCHAEAIWECKRGAACMACGAHGSRSAVVRSLETK
jgi:hypothetical protein